MQRKLRHDVGCNEQVEDVAVARIRGVCGKRVAGTGECIGKDVLRTDAHVGKLAVVDARGKQVRDRGATAVAAHKKANILACVRLQDRPQVVHHHDGCRGKANVVVLVVLWRVARDVEVAQPLRAIGSAHGYGDQRLFFTRRRRDLFGGNGVGNGVGRAAGEGGHVVGHCRAMLVGGGAHVVEAELAQKVDQPGVFGGRARICR